MKEEKIKTDLELYIEQINNAQIPTNEYRCYTSDENMDKIFEELVKKGFMSKVVKKKKNKNKK